MSGFQQSATLYLTLQSQEDRVFMQRLLADLTDGSGRIRIKSVHSFHCCLTRGHHFNLMRNDPWRERSGQTRGRHLFYRNGSVLVRVKTQGTEARSAPHLTMSLAAGLGWDEEIVKFSRHGEFTTKSSALQRAGFRALCRLSTDFEVLARLDDQWANTCHFDFVDGFDDSGATGLAPTI